MATHNFNITELTESQSQKATSVNEGLFILDAVAGGYVVGVSATPPVSAVNGTLWIVASGGTGDWSAKDTNIAIRVGGAWRYVEPKTGISFVDSSTDNTLKFNGTIWIPVESGFTETSADAKYLTQASADVLYLSAATPIGGGGGGGDSLIFYYGDNASNNLENQAMSTSNFAVKGTIYTATRTAIIGEVETVLQTVSSSDVYAVQVTEISASTTVKSILMSANYSSSLTGVATNDVIIKAAPPFPVSAGKNYGFVVTYLTGNPASPARIPFPGANENNIGNLFDHQYSVRSELSAVSTGTSLDVFSTSSNTFWAVRYGDGDLTPIVNGYTTEHSITWTSTASYAHGDTVQITSAVWFCLNPNTTETPGTGSDWVQIGTI